MDELGRAPCPNLAIGITAADFVFMLVTLMRTAGADTRATPAAPESGASASAAPVVPTETSISGGALRVRSLELVDGQGQVRAFLGILPADPSQRMPSGKAHPETVMLRLMDPSTGRPGVKLVASERGSSLGLLGESSTRETWAIVGADGTASSVRLRNEGGREQRVRLE